MIQKILTLLDWIYKKRCYFCKNSNESVRMCSECYEKLTHLPAIINRSINGVNIICSGIYSKELQKLIRGLKYHRQRDLAYYQAKFMYEFWTKFNFNGDFIVVPVPLHKARKKKRKYNHMELVAVEFCNLSGYDYNFEIIKRIKNTKPQYKLTKKERAQNLQNAFEVSVPKNFNKKVLILDDICTTGSTFEEMINEFKKNGVHDIICFATTTPF